MKYALLFEHKTFGQRGVVDVYDTEDLALQAACKNAVRSEFHFYVCPMQTHVSGDVMITTTVVAQNVTTTAVNSTATPVLDAAPSPLTPTTSI
jgi:hypothetical protein